MYHESKQKILFPYGMEMHADMIDSMNLRTKMILNEQIAKEYITAKSIKYTFIRGPITGQSCTRDLDDNLNILLA